MGRWRNENGDILGGNFHPKIVGEDAHPFFDDIIFFKWVGSTTKEMGILEDLLAGYTAHSQGFPFRKRSLESSFLMQIKYWCLYCYAKVPSFLMQIKYWCLYCYAKVPHKKYVFLFGVRFVVFLMTVRVGIWSKYYIPMMLSHYDIVLILCVSNGRCFLLATCLTYDEYA